MTINTTLPNWYVLYTMPHHEVKVSKDLERQEITTFLPMRKEIRFWSDRKKSIMVPMFSNYLFVSIEKKERARALKTAGVVRFLDSNANPSVVANKDIDLIKIVMNGNVETLVDKNIVLGDNIRITSGPLSGLCGPIVTMKSGDRMLVKVTSINKELLVDISGHCVEKVSVNLRE